MAIVLNEVLGSTTGADVEFIELFGDAGESLAGLSVIVVESDAGGANGTIDFRFDFDGADALGGNGFFLLGNNAVAGVYGVDPDALIADNAIENSSYTIALVETASLSGGSVTGGEVVRDAVGVSDGGAGDSFFFGAPVIGPDGSFLPAGFRREIDGGDVFAFADFNNSTAVNTPTPAAGVVDDDAAPAPANALEIEALGTLELDGAEIVDVDPATDRAFVTSGDGLHVVDASDPDAPALIETLDPADFGFNASSVTSVTVKNDIVAIALPDDVATNNGDVLFFRASTLEFLGAVEVGPLPDALFFNDAGTHIVVANEGESAGDENEPFELPNPNGSVSIIAVNAEAPSSSTVTTLDFTDPSISFDSLAAKGVRVNRDAPSAAADIEPEYVTISGDTAFITLQENNAVAVIEDIANPTPFTIDSIQPLGLQDHASEDAALDPSNRDDGINIANFDVFGLRQPDAIASYVVEGVTYYVTANEGDGRDVDETRGEDLVDGDLSNGEVDAGLSQDLKDQLADEALLGRLKFSNVDGDTDGDGDIDVLHSFGSRSFTIFDEFGNVVFDSGDDFERITAEVVPELFNSDGDAGSFDSRSDDKGPEPEAVAVGEIDGLTYAFVGLERVGGIMVYDITDPTDVVFDQYIRNEADIAPEGLKFVSAEDSPTNTPLLAVASEESETLTFFSLSGTPVVTIMDIQGEGHVSPFVLSEGQTVADFFDDLPAATFNVFGDTVTTSGVVTAVDTNGFYLQDPTGDGNDATSDAIFVFTSGAPGVNVGDGVTVTGDVAEFFPGDTDDRNIPLTQLSANVADVTVASTGNALPAAVIIGANGRLPIDRNIDDDAFADYEPAADGIDFFESLEAMLVTAEDVVAVAATNRFGEIFGVVDGGEGASGVSDRGTLNISQDDFNPEKIQIDEDSGVFNFDFPDVDVGASLGDVTGVISYSFGNFEILPTLDFTGGIVAADLEPETTEIAAGEDTLTVASYNVLNLEPNDGDGDTDVADGRFSAIASQIVDNLNAPDIVGLQEVQDNSGSDDDGVVAANLTLQLLIDEIVAAGGPAYAFIDNTFIADGLSGGQPGGNIRTAFLFDPTRVSVDAASIRPVATQDPGDAFNGARLPLAADFEFNGETVTVVNNHFSSKGGSAPILGIEQDFAERQEDPGVNGSLDERRVQAQAVNDFVDGVLAENADAKVVVLGDLNEFEFVSPLDILEGAASTTNGFDLIEGGEPILTNLIDGVEDGERYSFIFQGNSQELDHILVSDSLLDGAEIDIVHVNTEFAETDERASDHDPLVASLTIPPVDNVFTLQLLHASDLEGGVEAIDDAPNFAAVVERLESEFADNTIVLSAGDNYLSGPFFSAANDQAAFRDSGILNDVYNDFFGLDPAIDASVYDSLREGGGRVDVSIMNLIGFDASAVGNHEFDLGSDIFQSIIEEDFRGGTDGPTGDRWVGAQFPYLSADLDFSEDPFLGNLFTDQILLNTDFQTGPDQSNAGETDTPKIAPATLVEVDGELVGVVGATTQVLEQISSPTGTTVIGPNANDMAALAAILQPTIDATIAAGTNKVILVSHLQQFQLEQELAGFLKGVDIIVAGGSDTIVADAEGGEGDDRLRVGDEADVTPYPFVGEDADGAPVAIVSTDGEYSYVGRLVIDFDEDGHIIAESIDRTESGAFATDDQGVADVFGIDESEIDAVAFADGTNAELVKRLVDAAKDVVEAKDGAVFGETEVFLDGNRESVRTEETNLGNLTADANLSEAQKVDETVVLSLKNGGGVRAPIGEVDQDGVLLPPQANPDAGKLEGQISQLDIENALKFNNGLSLVTLTAEELLQVMEHAVSATGPGVTPGQFPQIGGFTFSFDATQPAGARIETIALLTEDGEVGKVIVLDGEVIVDPATAFRMVTLNFLADGGDGYPFPDLANPNRVDLFDLDAPEGEVEDAEFADFGTEQDALAEFLAENHGIGADTPFDAEETDPEDDFRIQNLEVRDDGILDEITITGNNRDNELIGSDLVDLINGRGGDDLLRGQGDDDILLGGDGDDILHGQAGDDSAYGQDGDDMVLGGDGDDLVDGGDGDDYILGQDGDDTANGGDGDDTIVGGLGDDLANGGDGDDKLVGQEGDDGLNGGDGDDDLRGDAGDDVLAGGDGDDLIKGGDGDDVIDGGDGDDVIREGAGDDNINGGDGDDLIVGGVGADDLNGGDGDDAIFGGLGNDLLTGGDGVDVFHFSRADAVATGEGFNGDFIVDFENKVDELSLGGLNIVGFESDDFNDDGAIDIGLITDVDDFTIVILGTPLGEEV